MDELKELQQAVDAFDVERVRRILGHSPELVHARTEDASILGLAIMTRRKEENYDENMIVRADQVDLVEALLDAGADVNERTGYGGGGLAPLAIAAWLGKFGFVELLLARGADPNCEPEHGDTAIRVAADHNRTAIVERLIKAGARFHVGQLAQAGLIGRLETWFDQHPNRVNEAVDLGHRTGWTGTPLHAAVDSRRPIGNPPDYESVVQLLLNRGADVNAVDSIGRTALNNVLYYNALKNTPMGNRVIEILLERGTTVDLFAAMALGDIQRVQELLSKDPKLVNIQREDVTTPLHMAASIDLSQGRSNV